ncbi:MAG: hypothetical protein WCO56_11570 [Verrucomicrobiota bacterium]
MDTRYRRKQTDYPQPQGKADVEAFVACTGAECAPLAEAIRTAFVPVKHEIKINPVP